MSAKHANPALVKLMDSGKFSDLKFACGEQELKVHKAIVCVHSPVINAAVQRDFEEPYNNVITMHNFRPDTVKRLVQFMYTGDYDDPDDACLGAGKVEIETATPMESKVEIGSSTRPPVQWPRESAPPCALFEHMRVNSIGDYYGVCRARFASGNAKIKLLLQGHVSDRNWALLSLPTALEAALELTGDGGLLDMLAAAAAVNMYGRTLESDGRSSTHQGA